MVVQKTREWPKFLEGQSGHDFLADAVARVIAEYVAPDLMEILYQIFVIYQTWSQPYIAHTTFIRAAKVKGGLNMFEMSAQKMVDFWESSPEALSLNY